MLLFPACAAGLAKGFWPWLRLKYGCPTVPQKYTCTGFNAISMSVSRYFYNQKLAATPSGKAQEGSWALCINQKPALTILGVGSRLPRCTCKRRGDLFVLT